MFALKEEYLPKYDKSDYETWEGNWELISGIPFAMAPAPGWYHQELNWKICAHIQNALNGCKNCKVNMPVNWLISPNTIVQPDVVVVCKPFEEGIYLKKTPEIIFEILSQSTSDRDVGLKYELYQNNGVKYYVIVHPIEKFVEIFTLGPDNQYSSAGRISLENFHFDISGCSFDMEFGEIW